MTSATWPPPPPPQPPTEDANGSGPTPSRVDRTDAQEERSRPAWGWIGLVGVAVLVVILLLSVGNSSYEKLLIFIPAAIVFVALGLARLIEQQTTSDLEEALARIEQDGRVLNPHDAWSKELHRLRSEYLLDVRAHAERWRTIFSSLLAVFGAIVLVGRPQSLSSAGQPPEPIIVLTVLGLSAGLTAIAMAGWAAAGSPKIDWLMQTDPAELRRRIFFHANRSAARLRAALTCGVVALVAILAGTAMVLLGGRG